MNELPSPDMPCRGQIKRTLRLLFLWPLLCGLDLRPSLVCGAAPLGTSVTTHCLSLGEQEHLGARSAPRETVFPYLKAMSADVGDASGTLMMADASPSQNPESESFRELLASFVLDVNPAQREEGCLITQEPLRKQHVRLPCGHSFNYDAIYKEVERQKYRRNYHERPRLGDNQVRCPYCNAVHGGLLPPCRGYESRARVNSPLKWGLPLTSQCEHVYTRGRHKGNRCTAGTLCGETRCKRHAPRLAPE